MSLTFPGADLGQRGLGVSYCGCPWNGGYLKIQRRGVNICSRESFSRCRVSSASAQIPPGIILLEYSYPCLVLNRLISFSFSFQLGKNET